MRRTVPLDQALRLGRPSAQSFSLEVPLQYVEKAVPPRRLWAADLGLADRVGTITDVGRRVLDGFGRFGLVGEKSIVFWPYAMEMSLLRLDPTALKIPVLTPWQIASSVGAAMSDGAEHAEQSDRYLLQFVREVYQLYRDGDVAKSMLRQQLPLFLLFPTYIAYQVANDQRIADLPAFLQRQYSLPERALDPIAIRGTEGAVLVRRGQNAS